MDVKTTDSIVPNIAELQVTSGQGWDPFHGFIETNKTRAWIVDHVKLFGYVNAGGYPNH